VSRRILVADANVDAAESLAWILQLNGYRTVTAETGPDALAMASVIHPEVAFLSLHLTHIGGLDVARVLCAGTRCTRPKLLIALTGDGRESAREASRQAGFDHHLLKPADPDHILSLLQSLT
jgi:CheY-like chemotaxis protein